MKVLPPGVSTFQNPTMAFFGKVEYPFLGARRDLRAPNESLGLYDSGATYKRCLRRLGEREIEVKVGNLALSGTFGYEMSL